MDPDWYSGDCLYAPGRPVSNSLFPDEVIRRIAPAFRRVVIDWTEGDRWVDWRIAKHTEIGSQRVILVAEHYLKGRSVLISVADESAADAPMVKFYLTPDTGTIDLHYEPSVASADCRWLAKKLAALLGYTYAPEGVEREPSESEMALARSRIESIDKALSKFFSQRNRYPACLQDLAIKQPDQSEPLLSMQELEAPWGFAFSYDLYGHRNGCTKPDVWATTPDERVIGNWILCEPAAAPDRPRE